SPQPLEIGADPPCLSARKRVRSREQLPGLCRQGSPRDCLLFRRHSSPIPRLSLSHGPGYRRSNIAPRRGEREAPMAADPSTESKADALFADLEPLRERLDEASSRNNRPLLAAKEKLKALSLGIEAWVPIHLPPDGDLVEFGYARLDTPTDDPRWDLWVRLHDPDGVSEPITKPALSARREIRALVVG